jgi:hypothetical protein
VKRPRPSPPRLALTPSEAAQALGMSEDSFNRHVRPEVRVARVGRMVLVSTVELERWVREHSAFTLPHDERR